MVGAPTQLAFGDRKFYAKGLFGILHSPLLTMEQEFSRAYSWTDWTGKTYTLQEEWAYVNGRARAQKVGKEWRDLKNGGKEPEAFRDEVNEMIRRRRAEGGCVMLPHWRLTLQEVLSIRLYTGPAYEPLNNFVRSIRTLASELRELMLASPLTFAQTVYHIESGVRTLSAVAETRGGMTLFRGLAGKLPDGFFDPDQMGIICLTEPAMLSTSTKEDEAIQYCLDKPIGPYWLMKILPGQEDDTGFHNGADVAALSQYAKEAEVLFPPLTFLVVQTDAAGSAMKETRKGRASTSEDGALGEEKNYTVIEMKPTFI